ncbi:endolytic transglycosylase MltG [Bifidobacterium callimiconis]|uniref:Endolytic murein transglycosylase n=1 Tax=Bifidobacterium callimiconis TaxID=2306973 RepID=A0A430FI04_9BIFI|nr:endolytic transglycosylase MltG [Bifidobacterium callimiconis]RSX52489.1 YceG-like family [Bifidobacterium callimiconis]
MADDDMQDFFAEQAEWVGGDGEPESASNTPPRPPRSRKEMQKYRRKQQRARQIKVIIAVVFVVLVGLCGWLLFSKLGAVRNAVEVTRTEAADYPGPGSGDVEFTVESGQNSVQIGDNLEKKGIVKSSAAFQQAVRNAGLENHLQPGVFELKYRMKADAVVKVLTDSSKAKGFLVVNSGERLSAVLDQAAELSGIDRSEFQAIIDNKGDGILPAEAGGSFEGWLEPGNYNVKDQKSAEAIMKMMVEKRITKLDQLGVPTGDDRERILKIASIAEGEVNKSDYYGKVTRVIENRLAKDMPLGMDSVIAYGNNVEPRALTKAMLNDTSNPYNSRSQKGLPPTPINQPGDNAIKAAMNPEEGDWLYFVTVNLDTGETKFTADENEFQQFSKEYEAWEAEN